MWPQKTGTVHAAVIFAVHKATLTTITLFGSRTEPMSISTFSSLSRESETKQIDHNDSIRATYMSIEDIRAMGASAATSGVSSLSLSHPSTSSPGIRERKGNPARLPHDSGGRGGRRDDYPGRRVASDNHYIAEEAIQEVRAGDFPKRFYRELPTIDVERQRSRASLALAWLYVAHTHSTISQEKPDGAGRRFQEHETLRIGELWALPSLVRYVLVENLRRISIRASSAAAVLRRRANEAADELVRLTDPAKPPSI